MRAGHTPAASAATGVLKALRSCTTRKYLSGQRTKEQAHLTKALRNMR
jgi:hypothetical protein